MNAIAESLAIDLVNFTTDAMTKISLESKKVIKKHGPEHTDLRSLAATHEYMRKLMVRTFYLLAEYQPPPEDLDEKGDGGMEVLQPA